MNGNDIFKAMNGLDERYIASAIRPRPITHRPRRFAARLAIGIAAALALAVPAGAFYSQFIHKAQVREYFADDTADYLEDKGLALNYTTENEHIRLTVDTLLSDGHIGTMILTLEGLDQTGLDLIQADLIPDIYVSDPDTGEYVPLHDDGSPQLGGGGMGSFSAKTDTQVTVQRTLLLEGLDTDKEYLLTFGKSTNTDGEPGWDRRVDLTNGALEGLSFKTNFAPNVDVREFESDSGEHILVSQLGFWTSEKSVARHLTSLPPSDREIRLIKSVGILTDRVKTHQETYDSSPTRPQPLACGWFRSIVEISEYSGIRIGDLEFTEN